MNTQTIVLGIACYVIVVLLLIWRVNKISKDSTIILVNTYRNLNSYFLAINQIIANQSRNIPKFDELIDVVYAKKKWFIHNKTHSLTDQYELFIGLQDTLEYLSDYLNEDYRDSDLYKKTESLFQFLFSIKNRQKVVRGLLAVLTVGVGLLFTRPSSVL